MVIRLLTVLLLLSLVVRPRIGLTAPQAVVGPEPYGGLKSVADKASGDWERAHGELRKNMTDMQDPCNPARRASLERAKMALKEKTRAWKAFYSQRGADAKSTADAAEKAQVDTEAAVRTEQDNRTKAEQLLSELKLKRDNLKNSDPEGKSFSAAIQDLEETISVHSQIIDASQQTVKQLQEISAASRTGVQDAATEAQLARAYELLIDQQNRFYESYYRARELRLGLECRPPRVPPPPPIREP